MRKMKMVVKIVNMKEHHDDVADLEYWLSRPPIERISAVTSITFPGEEVILKKDLNSFLSMLRHKRIDYLVAAGAIS